MVQTSGVVTAREVQKRCLWKWTWETYGNNVISLLILLWETICDAQAGFWLHSKFLSKFSRKPLSGISDQKAPPPHFRKLQIWDDQSLLRNTPPFWKISDLGWPKFTLEYPPPHFGKFQIWDDKSLLQNTPPFQKPSDLGWPKFTLEYPPFRKFQIWDDQVYSGIPPSPISENFRFGMTKVYSGNPPPHFGKLQIWDDQSLLWNPPPPFQNISDLGWPKFTLEYHMWRLICKPHGYHSL